PVFSSLVLLIQSATPSINPPLPLRRKRFQSLADDRRRLSFDVAIGGDQRLAEWRQYRAATAAATRCRFDHRRLERGVDFIDEEPGAAVRHLHLARRRRDRPGRADELEQLDLAGPDPALIAKIDPEACSGIGDH